MSSVQTEGINAVKEGEDFLLRASESLASSGRGYTTDAHNLVSAALAKYSEAAEKLATLTAADRQDWPWMHALGYALRWLNRPHDALDVYTKAATLAGTSRVIQRLVGQAYWECREIDKAYEVLKATVFRRDRPSEWRFNCDVEHALVRELGQLLLCRERFEEGWVQWDLGRDLPSAAAANLPKVPVSVGPGAFANKRVLVIGEQGLGDEVMYASCIPDVLQVASSCAIACSERLVRVFAESFGRAEVLALESAALDRACSDAEVVVPIGSLPRFFRNDRTQFPTERWIRPQDARVEHWRSVLKQQCGTKRAVGLSWRGGKLTEQDGGYRRLIPPRDLHPLCGIDNVVFFNLQHSYDPAEGELRDLLDHGLHLVPPPGVSPEDSDLSDYFAFVTALDLVVSADNANVHFAGAMAVNAWALLSYMPDWRWGIKGDTSYWYPSVELLRQNQPGNWKPVVEQVAKRLTTGR